MSFFAPLLVAALQAGPNPSLAPPDPIPPELREQRKRTRARQASETTAPSRLVECLRLIASDPQAALDSAERWRTNARGADRARAGHCQGLALVQLGRFGEAQAVFLSAREANAGADRLYAARLGAMAGNAALAGAEPAGAVPAFTAAIADAREEGDMTLTSGLETDLARALVMTGANDEAAAALDRARQADAANTRAWLLSATLARRMERLGQAQQFIQQAATLDARDPAIGLEAGVIAALSGRDADARASFASVIDVAPDSDEARRAATYLEQLSDVTP